LLQKLQAWPIPVRFAFARISIPVLRGPARVPCVNPAAPTLAHPPSVQRRCFYATSRWSPSRRQSRTAAHSNCDRRLPSAAALGDQASAPSGPPLLHACTWAVAPPPWLTPEADRRLAQPPGLPVRLLPVRNQSMEMDPPAFPNQRPPHRPCLAAASNRGQPGGAELSMNAVLEDLARRHPRARLLEAPGWLAAGAAAGVRWAAEPRLIQGLPNRTETTAQPAAPGRWPLNATPTFSIYDLIRPEPGTRVAWRQNAWRVCPARFRPSALT